MDAACEQSRFRRRPNPGADEVDRCTEGEVPPGHGIYGLVPTGLGPALGGREVCPGDLLWPREQLRQQCCPLHRGVLPDRAVLCLQEEEPGLGPSDVVAAREVIRID